MIDIKSFSKPKKSGNGSGGSSSSVTYISGIASEADHATRADKAKKAEVAEQANVANRATSAQTASYASKAGEVDIESETLQKFLRKDDPAEGEENVAEEVHRKVDFKKAATFEEAADMLKKFTAHELAAFLKGFTIAGQFGIDEYGDMILNTIKSLEYNNAAEQGFSVEKEKNGKYHAFVTNLTIWGKAIFHELEVRKLSYSGGNIYLSGAGSKLVKVIPVKKSVSDGVTSWVETTADDTECVGWKCYLLADNGTTATMNYWQEGDQVRCQTIGEITAGGTYQDASNKSYWRTIPNGGVSTQNEKIYGTMTETYLDEAGKEQTREVQVELYGGQSFAWIVVGKHSEDLDGYTDEDSAPTETRGIPADGDTIVLDGNRHRNEHGEYDKTDRQNVIVLETTGEYAPRIACYANISEYKHTITKSVNGEDKEVSLSVFETSPKGGTKINSSRFEWISNDGSTINIINYRGDWVKGNTYHKNDQVNHNNAVWVCVANSEESVIAEPSDSSTQWKKVLYGGKGEKGDDAVSYSVQFSEGTAMISGVATKVLDVTFVKSVGLQIRSGGIRDIDFNGTCVVYVDGVRSDDMTNYLMFGYTYLDIYNAFANEIKGKKSLSVELRDSDNRVVASNIFFFAEKGEKGEKGDKGEQGIKGDKGKDGVDGTDGKDAVSILIEDAPLIFDTDDNGIVPISISKVAKVKVMKGNLNISNECSNISSRNDLCVNCKCGAIQKDGYIEVSVSGSNITKNDVIVDGVSQGKVSATSGYAVAQATYGGVTYFAQVPFSVNVAKFTGVVAFDNDGYKSQFKEVTNRLNDTATKDDLKKAESDFKQTAREISLSVSEKAMGRRNMLSGSALRRKVGEGVRFEGNGYVSLSDNYLGTNSYVGTSKAKDTYLGLHWIGASDSQSVRVQKGHTYTLSCWIKADSTSIPFTMEAVWQASASDYTRPAGYAGPGNDGSAFQIRESVNKVNIWQLITTTFTIPSDASYEYLEIYLFFRSNDDGIYTVSMSRPMMEEGNKYSGIWSLSEKDFDYIGGNLLDNTATFANDDNDNVNFVNKVIENGYEGKYNVAYAKNEKKDTHTEIAMWGTQSGNLSLTSGTDYVFSFLAKGTGRITCYMFKDGTPIIYTDNKETNGSYISDGHIDFALEPTWRKFYVHWRVAGSNLPTDVLIRAADITEAWIAQPKLEVGCTMTDWTEKRTDMVDRQALLATGIDITNGKITITANNTIFRDNNGTTIALFTGGKINASLIDADQIEVKHLWAKSNDGASKVGYFGNTEEEACKIDDTYAPLFVGADTAKNSPFYVTNKGHMVSKSATLGSFSLNESSLRYLTGYDDEEPGFALYNEYMVFRGYSRTFSPQTKKWTSERNRLIWVGRNDWVYSVPSLMSNILVQDSFPMTTGDTAKIGLRISVTGCDDKYQYENVMYNGAMGSNVYGNFAIYAENGMYAGFRPMTRRANYSMKLTELDCVIYVPVTGITLTLPDNPQRGQYYKFIQGSEGKQAFWIKSNSYKMYWNGVDTNGRTSFDSGACNQTTEFIFLGDHWRVNWYREAAI